MVVSVPPNFRKGFIVAAVVSEKTSSHSFRTKTSRKINQIEQNDVDSFSPAFIILIPAYHGLDHPPPTTDSG
jgi:hypothetical protein